MRNYQRICFSLVIFFPIKSPIIDYIADDYNYNCVTRNVNMTIYVYYKKFVKNSTDLLVS